MTLSDTRERDIEKRQDRMVLALCDAKGKEIEEIDFYFLILSDTVVPLHPDLSLSLLKNDPFLVSKGKRSLITRYHLHVRDSSSEKTKFSFVLDEEPKNGTILLRGEILKHGSHFQQRDINRGHLSYQHDGSNNRWDTFTFKVVESTGKEISQHTALIKTTLTNHAPVLVHKNEVTIPVGATVLISNQILSVTDPEQGPDSLYFTMLSTPQHGYVILKKQGILPQGAQFSQSEIDNKEVYYSHQGKIETDDFFAFSVHDGAGGMTDREELRFHIHASGKKPAAAAKEAQPQKYDEIDIAEEIAGLGELEDELNEIFNLDMPRSFPVNKGSSIVITSRELQIFDALSDHHRGMDLTLIQAPEQGELRYDREVLAVGHNLTLDQFDSGLVTYRHKSSDDIDDLIIFEIENKKLGTKTTGKFYITVIDQHSTPLVLEHHLLFVQENSSLMITKRLLRVCDETHSDAELIYTITQAPQHGTLINMAAGVLEKVDTFTQEDINQGSIAYSPTSKAGTEDTLMVSVSNGAGGIIDNLPILIEITKEPIAVVINNALLAQEGERTPFTENHLFSMNTAEEKMSFHYRIKSIPKHGSIICDKEQLKVGDIIQQDSIEKGKVVYSHQGST